MMCISNCIKHIISEFNAYYLWQSMHFFGSARLQAASSDLVPVSAVGRQPWLAEPVRENAVIVSSIGVAAPGQRR